MKKSFVLLHLFLLLNVLSSCVFEDEDISHITKKNSIKNFEALNNPIVVTMPVSHYTKNGKIKHEIKDGDIFVVIDWESDKVFDWIYSPDPYGSTISRCVELSNAVGTKRYFSSSEKSGLANCIENKSTKVFSYNTNRKGLFLNSRSVGGVKTILSNTFFGEKNIFCGFIFNGFTGNVDDKKIEIETTSSNLQRLVADESGNLWTILPNNENDVLYKIDANSCEYKEIVKLDNQNFAEDIFGEEHEEDVHNVIAVNNGIVFIERTQYGPGNHEIHKPKIFIVDSNSSNPYENMKTISVPDEIKNFPYYLYDGVIYKGNLYVAAPLSIGFEGITDDDNLCIIKFDIENESSTLFGVPLKFRYNQNIWLRKNRLYLMNSWNPQKISYTYIDLDTGIQGKVVKMDFDNIVGK